MPSATSMSAGAAASSAAAAVTNFSRTRPDASWMELPAFTALREANVPTPKGIAAVSPPTTVTHSSGMPRASAAICANDVSCPWPWLHAPGATVAWPEASSLTGGPPAGPLVRPDRGALHVAGEADAAVDAALAEPRLFGAQRFVAYRAQRVLERGLAVAAVVDQ